MKKILKKTVPFLKIAVTILIIIAIVSDGAKATQRLFSFYNNLIIKTKLTYEGPRYIPLPSTDEKAPGNMACNSKPNCEQPAYLTALFIVKSDNSENRHIFGDREQNPLNNSAKNISNKSTIISSTFLISTDLGYQFTLVGAKPSGTS
ncbi:MAG: hypothetical protein ACE5D6_03940 [Candidatus Zixiibacteriota bacterium]